MSSALSQQLGRCQDAIKSFARCMKERRWHKVAERSDRINKEMALLQVNLSDAPELDDDVIEQVKYLDIQLRRVQRQLSMQMQAINDDVQTLEYGISRADAGKALLLAD